MEDNKNPTLSRRHVLAAAAAGTMFVARANASSAAGGEVWFVRHGESQINVTRKIEPGAVPQRDDGVRFPLTVKGIEQVKSLAGQFSGITPVAILASTRLRAIQTADAISFETLVPVTPVPALVEVDVGTLTTAPDATVTSFGNVYEQWLSEGDVDARMPGGESRRDVEARALPFVRAAIEEFRVIDKPLVFVAHGALIAIIAPHIFGNVDHRYAFAHPIANTGIVRGGWRDGGLRCSHWSGTCL